MMIGILFLITFGFGMNMTTFSVESEIIIDRPYIIKFHADYFRSNVPLTIPWSEQYYVMNIGKRKFKSAFDHQKDMFRTHVLSILYGATQEEVIIDIPSHVTRAVKYAIISELHLAGYSARLKDEIFIIVRVPLPKLY
jgi:molybdopterin-binding protein